VSLIILTPVGKAAKLIHGIDLTLNYIQQNK